jgi:nicotinamidase-related amidase
VNQPGPTIVPQQAALLVMDYQNGIFSRVHDPDALLKRAARAIDVARRNGMHVGYVRVAFNDEELQALPDRNKMKAFVTTAGAAVRSDSPMTAIHDDIAPQPGDIVVRKTRVGPFGTTDLDDQLRKRGITTVILAGISTSGVVLSTVRDAADRDYRIFVLADATADPQQDVHDFLIEKIFPRQADVIAVDDLEKLLSSASGA